MNTKPYRYQLSGVRKIERFEGRALLADEAGLGKTLSTLLYLKRNLSIRPAIVVCPASLKWNWEREARFHFSWQSEVLENLTPGPEWIHTPNILIVNYDILHPRGNAPGWLDRLRSVKPKVIILDECQALQNRSAKRTKAVKALCKGVPHVLALSGTPLTNRPAELYPVLNILRPDLFHDWRGFAQSHCNPQYRPWGWEYKGATRLDELHDKLNKHLMIRRLKKDVLQDLPEKRFNIVPLPLSDAKQYRTAHNDFVLWLANHKPEKLNRATRAERLVQVGYLKRLAGELKLPAVIEWIDSFLEDSTEKLVVFAVHKAIIKRLRERYAKICVVIDGSTSNRDRRLAVEKFQNAPSCRVFIGNIKAAGVGLTLTAASTVLFAELGWTPGEHSQAVDRCHRLGQHHPVDAYYTIGMGTIEERLIELINKKQTVLDATLDGRESEETEIFNQLIKGYYAK